MNLSLWIKTILMDPHRLQSLIAANSLRLKRQVDLRTGPEAEHEGKFTLWRRTTVEYTGGSTTEEYGFRAQSQSHPGTSLDDGLG